MSVGHYPHIVRHTGPRDFTRDLVRFDPVRCRCGAWPENPNWLACYDCQAAVQTEKPAKARGTKKRNRGPNIAL